MKGASMEYTKPVVLAQNSTEQCFAAGCPANGNGDPYTCRRCDRAQ